MTDTSIPVLAQGTWVRSRVPVSDGGDYNEREADAGALGTIDLVNTLPDGRPNYNVVFWPTFICCWFNAEEAASDLEVLPAGHPDIPTPEAYDLPSAVADILVEGDVDEDEAMVTAPAGVVARILAGATVERVGAEGRALVEGILSGDRADGDTGEVGVSFPDFNRLAALVGVGDRLDLEDAPAP